MITLVNGPEGYIAGGFLFLGNNPNTLLREGDICCYNGHAPHTISSHGVQNPSGWIVDGYDGETIGYTVHDIEQTYSLEVPVNVAFWRKAEKPLPKPRVYEPSDWARPVPLP